MIYIGINYRVGPFGFLASQEVSVNGELDLNVGLHDQLFALRWIQQNIQFVSPSDPETDQYSEINFSLVDSSAETLAESS